MRNVPDDWDNYWVTCGDCGGRYHASEFCEACEDEDETVEPDDEEDEE